MRNGALLILLVWMPGCAALPDIKEEAQFHNPFPQLHRVAVLPFVNQSQDLTLAGGRVTLAYYNELQKVPGFEVMPPGVVASKLKMHRVSLDETTDFQKLAQLLGVDVVVRGAITEYSAYYPPRMGLAVDWIAANPGFHPIPAGYGLPWGTAEEEYIPDSIVREAEFELARKQLDTQTPEFHGGRFPLEHQPPVPPYGGDSGGDGYHHESAPGNLAPPHSTAPGGSMDRPDSSTGQPVRSAAAEDEAETLPPTAGSQSASGAPLPAPATGPAGDGVPLPTDWPDPSGFLPLPPSPLRPPMLAQHKPIITHTRLYNGHDEQFTQRLAEYFYFRDDARFGGWQAYLQRSDDFIRFCCYLHLTEMLGARGGASQSRVVWRWPIGRYER